MRRFDGIQVLRGLAALLVAIAHATIVGNAFALRPRLFTDHLGGMLFGAWGVDLFFVVSGFIMARYSSEGPFRAGRHARLHFLLERLSRIHPPYWVALAGYVTVALLTGQSTWTDFESRAAHSLTLFPELHAPFYGFFLAIAWTLAFELFFYCVIAAFIARPGLLQWAVPAFLTALAAANGSTDSEGWLRFLGNGILLEFVAGWMTGVLTLHGLSLRPAAGVGCAVLGLLLFACTAVAGLAESLGAPGTIAGTNGFARALFWGGPAALVVLGIASLDARGATRWRGGAVRFGDASYSFYLHHLTLYFAFAWAWKAVLGARYGDVFVPLAALLAGAAAVILYRRVERPLYRALKGHWDRRFSTRDAAREARGKAQAGL
jgi:exopolysaccharide production protein ExoZ